MISVLFANLDPSSAQALTPSLSAHGIAAHIVSSPEQLAESVQREAVDVVFLDAEFPALANQSALAFLQQNAPGMPVIVCSSTANVNVAVEAVKAGATDFAAWPLQPEEVNFAVRKAMAQCPSPEDEPPPQSTTFGTPIIGDSAPMREVLQLVRRAASGNATVLIRGESGTGKELLAHRVHDMSPRRAGPFVKVHSAALPEQLLESELFGYEKGAFTGATNRKPGRVELAEGGTLFLDEIGDISAATQVKLLRVLQEKEYERLGGTQTLRANVRFVAATHKDLEAMVKAGDFREDLYYRLNVIPIWAPALRERRSDIDALVRDFCVTVSASNDKPTAIIPDEGYALLRNYDWPGNVRQLQNFIERLVVLAESPHIQLGVIRKELARLRGMDAGGKSAAAGGGSRRVGELSIGVTAIELDEAVRQAERKALEKALAKAKGNRTLAARILGVSRRTLYNKLAEHDLS